MNHIAELLFKHHSHVELHMHNPDAIIYTEASVISILQELGHPAPVWGEAPQMTVVEELEEIRKTHPNFGKKQQP